MEKLAKLKPPSTKKTDTHGWQFNTIIDGASCVLLAK